MHIFLFSPRSLINFFPPAVILTVVLVMGLSLSQGYADEGIQTRRCPTCKDEPAHGGLLREDSIVFASYDSVNAITQPDSDSLIDKIGDTFWRPAIYLGPDSQDGQLPGKWVVQSIELAGYDYEYTIDDQDVYAWYFTYKFSVYTYDMPWDEMKSRIVYPAEDTSLTLRENYIDQDFFKCSGVVHVLDYSPGVKMASKSAGSPGDTQAQLPSLSNAGADATGGGSGGCSSCTQGSQTPGAFNFSLNLGSNGDGAVVLNFAGNVAQADLLSTVAGTALSALSSYPGVSADGTVTTGTVVVQDRSTLSLPTPTVVATTTFASTYTSTQLTELTK